MPFSLRRLTGQITLIFFLAGASGLGLAANSEMPGIGDKAPKWSMKSTDGDKVKFPGKKPALVMFWASWCSYCKGLMSNLSDLQSEVGDSVEFIAINFASDGSELPPFALQLPFTHLIDGDDIAARYGVTRVPALFIVEDGKVTYQLDYPPPNHPSQTTKNTSEQIKLLVPWWVDRIRENLLSLTDVKFRHTAELIR